MFFVGHDQLLKPQNELLNVYAILDDERKKNERLAEEQETSIIMFSINLCSYFTGFLKKLLFYSMRCTNVAAMREILD